jgi:hypothetical protein
MGTTSNYSWPIPEDSDLVKDGAEAIRDLGNAIDTTVSSTTGLVHINTTTFSTVASQSVSNIFTSDYKNYRINLSLTSIGADGILSMRLRANTTDNSANSYITDSISISQTGTVAAFAAAPQTVFYLLTTDTGVPSGHYYSATIDLFRPNEAVFTTFQRIGNGVATDSSTYLSFVGGGLHSVASAFNGFTILNIADMTGEINVYGYNE